MGSLNIRLRATQCSPEGTIIMRTPPHHIREREDVSGFLVQGVALLWSGECSGVHTCISWTGTLRSSFFFFYSLDWYIVEFFLSFS